MKKLPGLHLLLVTQLVSAFADNALIFAAIALLTAAHAPSWNIPLLQEFFVLAYIVTAPFVGSLADRFPKNRVLLGGTLIKLAGAGALWAGVTPFWAYGLVGLGASFYSPAKYGILPELVPAERLVKANAWLEGSTIVAILGGTLLGGSLSDSHLQTLLQMLCGLYVLALVGTLFLPRTQGNPALAVNWRSTVGEFAPAVRKLWQCRDTWLTLVGTGLFWGTGAVLRLLLLAWVPYALHRQGNAVVSVLNATTAVGIVLGATLAGLLVKRETATRVLPAGVLLGAVVMLFGLISNIALTYGALLLVGVLGGLFVVPLNAVLQEKGKELVGAGRAVAVQNLVENSSMLVMLGAYLLLSRQGLSPVVSCVLMGVALTVAMLGLVRAGRRTSR